MASDTIISRRFYLPTSELYETGSKFGSNVPAFNNIYDVFINFSASSKLKSFVEGQNLHYNNKAVGSSLALYCSEAVLPGSNIQTSTVDGLRQGMSQHYATFRRFPDITLTWYTQQNYMTNDVFNSWVEFISPNQKEDGLNSFRKMRYPNEYKCPIEITAFNRHMFEDFDRLERKGIVEDPSTITYKIEQAFPVSIIASPLAYGTAQLIKTSVTFKYENYRIERTSIDSNLGQLDTDDTEFGNFGLTSVNGVQRGD